MLITVSLELECTDSDEDILARLTSRFPPPHTSTVLTQALSGNTLFLLLLNPFANQVERFTVTVSGSVLCLLPHRPRATLHPPAAPVSLLDFATATVSLCLDCAWAWGLDLG
jgi:hypothetical protein